jgi:hypothetical protein
MSSRAVGPFTGSKPVPQCVFPLGGRTDWSIPCALHGRRNPWTAQLEWRMAKNNNGGKPQADSDAAVSYDEFKDYEGQKYTGMKIGRSHKWYYDEGEWKEKKITPDLWQIGYAVTKRRAGRAPEGSGVPVGTEYHWYILAHQNVQKLNANDYTTSMTGLKFKVAHRRADSGKWSAAAKTQRKRMIGFLRDVIAELEAQQEAESAEAAAKKAAKKTAAKKSAVKKTGAKKTGAKKSAARKTAAKRPTSRSKRRRPSSSSTIQAAGRRRRSSA